MEKVFTNVSANPVILSDGSSVAPGEKTSPGQYELAKGSFWVEHGVLVSGAPLLAPSDSQQLADLLADNESLRQQLADAIAAGHDKDASLTNAQEQFQAQGKLLVDLQDKAKDLTAYLEAALKDLSTEQAKVQKLEADLKTAQAKAK